MSRFSRKPCLIAALLALGLLFSAAPLSADSADDFGRMLSIDSCKTRVGLAKVVLEVSNLRVMADRIEGAYRIKVPLFPFKNDHGRLRLDLPGSLDDVIRQQTPITGSGLSFEDGPMSRILAKIQPGGRLELQIETDDRKLVFQTDYRLN